MRTLTESAYMFAAFAHKSQKQKYTGEPYLNHCFEVSQWVRASGGDENMIAAALLHDTVEDTSVSVSEIETEFNRDVASLVEQLTDVSRLEDGSRSVRKAKDLAHLASATPRAKTIKLADILSNTRSIVMNDTEFAKIYIPEKEATLEVLKDASRMDPSIDLYEIVRRCIEYSKMQLSLDVKVLKLSR